MDFHLQPKQKQLWDLLITSGDDVATIIGVGGAKGGGKSAGADTCACLLAFELGKQYPGIKITIVRRVYDDLKKNHIDPILAAYPELYQFYRAGDKEIVFPGRGKIIFAYAETKEDVKRKFLGGFESGFIFIDEAQQFDQEELNWIGTANRWTNRQQGIPEGLCKVAMFFNPGGPGSEYIRRVFWLKSYEGTEKASSYAFIHLFGWDNYEWFRGQVALGEQEFYDLSHEERFDIFIHETSEGRKMNAYPRSIRAGYLLGSFDHFENQYFAGAWDSRLCVLDRGMVERIMKPWWPRWMAQDWGFGDHDCHLWFAVGNLSPSEWIKHFGGHTDSAMQVCIVYRENVISDRAEADLAMDIVNATPEYERKTIESFFLSQDAFGQKARQSGAHSVGQQFNDIMQRHGLPAPRPADQDRINGWRFMYNCLRQANLRGATFDDERAQQGPAVFVSAECPNVISSIPMAVRDPNKLEDVMRVAGALWEDCTDAVRYGLKSYLEPLQQAPVAVRRQELYDSYDAPEPEQRTMSQMTTLSMKMRMFDADERSRGKRIKRRR